MASQKSLVLAAFKRAYGITPIRSYALKESPESSVYKVSDKAGRLYCVKLVKPDRQLPQIQSLIATRRHLAEHGFFMPGVIANRDGVEWTKYENRYMYVYSFIEGERPDPSLKLAEYIGTSLGKLHSIPVPPHRMPVRLDGRRILQERLKEFKGLQDTHSKQIGWLKEHMPDITELMFLPKTIVHGDLQLDNLTKIPHGQVRMIDIDELGLGPGVAELAYACVTLCAFTPAGKRKLGLTEVKDFSWNRDWMEAMIAAYQRMRPMTPDERTYLPHAIRLTILRWIDQDNFADNFKMYKLAVERPPKASSRIR